MPAARTLCARGVERITRPRLTFEWMRLTVPSLQPAAASAVRARATVRPRSDGTTHDAGCAPVTTTGALVAAVEPPALLAVTRHWSAWPASAPMGV